MTETSVAADFAPRAGRWSFSYAKLVDALFWLTVASGSISFIEPSPYDVLILGTFFLWAVGGFTIHRAILPFVLSLSLWVLGGFLGLTAYWNEEDPVSFMYHTLFVSSTGIFFALFLSQRTNRRAELLLNGFAVSCVIAAAIGVSTWMIGDDWNRDGRAMAPFKDPNVLGTYMVLGVLYLVQRLLLGRLRFIWLVLPSLALILAALFLSFSRGSWGATILGTLLVIGFLFKTADSGAMRARILAGAAGVFMLAGVGLMGALSVDSVRDFFFLRASVIQDYDGGPNGRFGNQIRSIPMLLDLPNGFGPLRFRLVFGIEPHNSYVNAFASNGWLGGFSFIFLALSTIYVGFRQCLTRHPFMRGAQVVFPAAFTYLLQGLQIDLDHWRFYYLAVGSVWGIEAARRRWLRQGRPVAAEDRP